MPGSYQVLADQAGFLAAIGDRRLHELAQYCFARCPDRAPPRRGDLDAFELPRLLPILWRVDCRNMVNLRHRLLGEDLRQTHAVSDLPGRFRETYPPDYAAALRDIIEAAIAGPYAVRDRVQLSARAGRLFLVERLAFPVTSGEGEIVELFGASAQSKGAAVESLGISLDEPDRQVFALA